MRLSHDAICSAQRHKVEFDSASATVARHVALRVRAFSVYGAVQKFFISVKRSGCIFSDPSNGND